MTVEQVKGNISYIYLKDEVKKIAKEYMLSAEEVQQIENILKQNIGISKELCWL